ncbi:MULTISPECIES: helix-turn-helix domain-containing protein [unclassified Streptomyces]|uniref:AraC-like ligand-binding domain-containing protein n=1 Tax=unclassified Streptomyces TaxID=2593676 RepID=UPI003243FED3
MWTKLSADTVPEAERFDWFNDVVSNSLMPLALASERSAEFQADAAVLDLGAVQVSSFEYSHVRSRRTPALIRRGDPEQYQLSLLTRGRMWMSQCGGEAELAPGDMILWDTSHPFEADCRPGNGTLGALVVQLPRTALPLRAGRIDPLLGRRIGAESGMAAILAQFLTSLGTHGSECSPQELRRLGTVAVELSAAVLAQRADAYGELPAEARTRALRERIDVFIEHHLGDPELTPGLIAAAHGISVRRLYLLFREGSESVSATVRRRRLERCRDDLARPELAGRPVHDIAARWCFGNAAAFSRAFREAYGISPTEFRRAAARAEQTKQTRQTSRSQPSRQP